MRFRVQGPLRGLTACNCSMCQKKGIVHFIVPKAAFVLERGADALTTYTFNTGVAKHYFCGTCGIHPYYVPRSDPDKIDVNARCLDDLDLTALEVAPFDGRNWEASMSAAPPWRT